MNKNSPSINDLNAQARRQMISAGLILAAGVVAVGLILTHNKTLGYVGIGISALAILNGGIQYLRAQSLSHKLNKQHLQNAFSAIEMPATRDEFQHG